MEGFPKAMVGAFQSTGKVLLTDVPSISHLSTPAHSLLMIDTTKPVSFYVQPAEIGLGDLW